jgi:protein-S-isoprenylcysteine O-methyltransferase Ste14
MTVWADLGAIELFVSAVWLASEIILGRMTHAKADKADNLDKSSLRILWLTIIPSIIIGIFIGLQRFGFITTGSFTISLIGLLLIILGLIIRWIAILTLRSAFTSNVSIQTGQQLMNTGIYSKVRHPSYTGSLLSFLGLGMTFANWLSMIIIFVPIFLAFRYRIIVEEQVLKGFFGDKYDEYCAGTKRLFPGIY